MAVELYAEGGPLTPMRRDAPLVGAHGYVYLADVPDTRPAASFTPRIVPAHPHARVPLELPLVIWAK